MPTLFFFLPNLSSSLDQAGAENFRKRFLKNIYIGLLAGNLNVNVAVSCPPFVFSQQLVALFAVQRPLLLTVFLPLVSEMCLISFPFYFFFFSIISITLIHKIIEWVGRSYSYDPAATGRDTFY